MAFTCMCNEASSPLDLSVGTDVDGIEIPG